MYVHPKCLPVNSLIKRQLENQERKGGQASHRGGPGSRPGLASGICGGQNGAGAGFLRVIRFPLPKPFIPTSPSSQSPGAGTLGQ
jgi:hypothetical protein